LKFYLSGRSRKIEKGKKRPDKPIPMVKKGGEGNKKGDTATWKSFFPIYKRGREKNAAPRGNVKGAMIHSGILLELLTKH